MGLFFHKSKWSLDDDDDEDDDDDDDDANPDDMMVSTLMVGFRHLDCHLISILATNVNSITKTKITITLSCHKHTSYLSWTHGRCPWRKKSVMWRIFKLLYMTDEEKSNISPHVD